MAGYPRRLARLAFAVATILVALLALAAIFMLMLAEGVSAGLIEATSPACASVLPGKWQYFAQHPLDLPT